MGEDREHAPQGGAKGTGREGQEGHVSSLG